MIKAYASYFVSYLLSNLNEIANIQNIILFGSVAKGESTKESDVDIFIEVKKDNKKIKAKIEKIVSDFYKSRESLLFKARGIENKINPLIGKLDSWKDIKKSIESTGIVLYGRYTPSGISGKKYTFIFWDNIGKNRGAFLNKIYGFRVKDKTYTGLIEILNGKKLGKSSMMVPIEHEQEFIDLIKKYKVSAKRIEVYI